MNCVYNLFGIQPGKLHLGNIISLLNWKNISNSNNCKKILLIADLHRQTKKLSQFIKIETENCINEILSLNILNEGDCIIVQSDYKNYLFEMSWDLSNNISFNYLEKIFNIRKKEADICNVGLLLYPLLMACDLYLFGSNFLTVGHDQKMHIEFFKKCKKFKKLNRIQNYIFTEKVIRLDSDIKMSKSDINHTNKGIIYLDDSIETVYNKIDKGKTATNLLTSLDELNLIEFKHIKNMIYCISVINQMNYKECALKYLFKKYVYLKNDFKSSINTVFNIKLNNIEKNCKDLYENTNMHNLIINRFNMFKSMLN